MDEFEVNTIYSPPAKADPSHHLLCTLLNIITSPSLPKETHTSTPFFTSPPLGNLHYQKTFDRHPLLNELSIFSSPKTVKTFPTLQHIHFTLLTSSEVFENPIPSTVYRIQATLTAYDDKGKPISVKAAPWKAIVRGARSEGEEKDIFKANVASEWRIPEGAKNVMGSLGWDSVVAVLQAHARVRYGKDGGLVGRKEILDELNRVWEENEKIEMEKERVEREERARSEKESLEIETRSLEMEKEGLEEEKEAKVEMFGLTILK